MNNIFKKAKELGSAIVDSAEEFADDIKSATEKRSSKEMAFLVESFASTGQLEERLNELSNSFNKVDVQSVYSDPINGTTAVIKLEH